MGESTCSGKHAWNAWNKDGNLISDIIKKVGNTITFANFLQILVLFSLLSLDSSNHTENFETFRLKFANGLQNTSNYWCVATILIVGCFV